MELSEHYVQNIRGVIFATAENIQIIYFRIPAIIAGCEDIPVMLDIKKPGNSCSCHCQAFYFSAAGTAFGTDKPGFDFLFDTLHLYLQTHDSVSAILAGHNNLCAAVKPQIDYSPSHLTIMSH